jgi:hypothetical protein
MEPTKLMREALQAFIRQWGIEPHGVMMNNKTYDRMNDQRSEPRKTFAGLPIYRSSDVEENKIRFIL